MSSLQDCALAQTHSFGTHRERDSITQPVVRADGAALIDLATKLYKIPRLKALLESFGPEL